MKAAQITKENYFSIVSSDDFFKQFKPEVAQTFKTFDEVFREATDNGKDMNTYKQKFDAEMQEQLDLYFEKLNKLYKELPEKKESEPSKAKKKIQKKSDKSVRISKAKKPKFKAGQKLYWFDNDGTLVIETIKEVLTNEKNENQYKVTSSGRNTWEYSEQDIVKMLKGKQMFLDKRPPKPVCQIDPALRIIKRFLHLNGKDVSKDKLYSFLKNIHKLIQTKQIRKNNLYASDIIDIQKYLVKCINNSDGVGVKVSIANEKLEEFGDIVNRETESQDIKIIKRFLSLYTKPDKEKAAKLKHDIEALSNGECNSCSFDVERLVRSLESYLRTGHLFVTEFELNGLRGIAGINGLGSLELLPYATKVKLNAMRTTKGGITVPQKNSKSFSKFSKTSNLVAKYSAPKTKTPGASSSNTNQQNNYYYNPPSSSGSGGGSSSNEHDEYNEYDEQQPEKINSMEVKEMEFETVGFNGKWLRLIGDPSEPWSMMIYGNPGSGKSTLAIELAYYIAASFNKKVAYVAKEEGAGATLKDKFARKNAFHPNIDIFPDKLPDNPEDYDYIFLDSVSELGVTPGDFRALIDNYKQSNTSFVGVFKGTKGGSFRGSLDFEHSVDVSVSCEKGEAKTEKSRFGGSGSVTVYDDSKK